MLSQPIPRQNPEPFIRLKREISRLITGYGFQEIISYSLTSLEMLNKLSTEPYPVDPPPLRVAKPMTVEQEYLRPSLRANLLAALSENRKHEDGGIRLFELGKEYRPRPNDLPDEREILCGILSGPGIESSWQVRDELADFFTAKGVVEGLLSQLGVEASFGECSDHGLHLTKQAVVVVDGNELGVVGEIHPVVLERFDIVEAVYLFKIDLAALLPFTTGHRMFRPIARFPSVVRDMALVLDSGVAHQKVMSIITSFPLVEKVDIFDVYSGEQVPPSKKSLAYRITYQSPSHTLTDKEVSKVQKQILDRLAKDLGATLRA